MNRLNKAYQSIIKPSNLITCFKTDEEFIKWLELGNIKDLESTLRKFEEEELYEHCQLILNQINKLRYESE